MGYNYNFDIGEIVGLKSKYDNAQDDIQRQEIAKKAQMYYKSLQDNGHSDIADTLSKQNYSNAVNTLNKWGKTDNVEFKPYMRSLGKKYNLSESEIDNLIKWDDDTKQITFGNMEVLKPTALADGKSYFNDTKVLDSAMENYAQKMNLTPSDDAKYNTGMYDSQNKVKQQWGQMNDDKSNMKSMYADFLAESKIDPFETDWGKELTNKIMGAYGAESNEDYSNQIASDSSSNGGNIDSYSAANAQRQKNATINSGIVSASNTILTANEQRLNRIGSVLNGLGIFNQNMYNSQNQNIVTGANLAQNIFNNQQTKLNSQVSRDVQNAQITGKIPVKTQLANNPYLQGGETLINPNLDYSTLISNATDPQEKEWLQQARFIKTLDPKYSQWFDGVTGLKTQNTNEVNTFDKSIASTEKLSTNEITAQEKIQNDKNYSNEKIAGVQAKNNLDQIDKNASYKTTSDSDSGENEYDRALKLAIAAGRVVTDEQAEILGIPKGTVLGANAKKDVPTEDNENKVKTIIYQKPKNGLNELYFPIQELQRNRDNFINATSQEFIDKLIVAEAKKIATRNTGKNGKWEVEDVLKNQGFNDYKKLVSTYINQ